MELNKKRIKELFASHPKKKDCHVVVKDGTIFWTKNDAVAYCGDKKYANETPVHVTREAAEAWEVPAEAAAPAETPATPETPATTETSTENTEGANTADEKKETKSKKKS